MKFVGHNLKACVRGHGWGDGNTVYCASHKRPRDNKSHLKTAASYSMWPNCLNGQQTIDAMQNCENPQLFKALNFGSYLVAQLIEQISSGIKANWVNLCFW